MLHTNWQWNNDCLCKKQYAWRIYVRTYCLRRTMIAERQRVRCVSELIAVPWKLLCSFFVPCRFVLIATLQHECPPCGSSNWSFKRQTTRQQCRCYSLRRVKLPLSGAIVYSFAHHRKDSAGKRYWMLPDRRWPGIGLSRLAGFTLH